jgi:CheY-like chemotaxis protein
MASKSFEPALILVVEDEFFLQAGALSGLPWKAAVTQLMAKRYDALVTDVKLAGVMSGWEVARLLSMGFLSRPELAELKVS